MSAGKVSDFLAKKSVFSRDISSRVGSAFLTLSVTIERYMAISHPLNLDRHHLKSILVYVSTLLAIVYNIPRLEMIQRL